MVFAYLDTNALQSENFVIRYNFLLPESECTLYIGRPNCICEQKYLILARGGAKNGSGFDQINI